MIFLELFLTFLKVGLFSVGGGYAAMPLIQSLVVDGKKWMTVSEFADLVAISEMTPGPIAVNGATFVGVRVAGIPGALAATLGCIFPSMILVSVLAYFYGKYKKLSSVKTILGGMRPAVVALIASAGLTILIGAVFGTEGFSLNTADIAAAVLFAAAFFVIRRLKLSPIAVMLLCAALYTAINLIFK